MKSVLSQLFNGEIYPADQYSPRTEEYRRICREHSQHYKDFLQSLNETDSQLSKRFAEIMDEQTEGIPFEISEMFIDGFCLGARMMIEIFLNPATFCNK